MTRTQIRRGSEQNSGRVQLHSSLNAWASQLISAMVLLGGFGALLLRTSGFRHFDPARMFVAVVAALFFPWVMSARLRLIPLAYGDAEGLDLEWVWGDKRHIVWSELRELRVHRCPASRRAASGSISTMK